jgi:hypothetical protein
VGAELETPITAVLAVIKERQGSRKPAYVRGSELIGPLDAVIVCRLGTGHGWNLRQQAFGFFAKLVDLFSRLTPARLAQELRHLDQVVLPTIPAGVSF